MSFAGRIIYNSIVVDFVRQWSDFAVRDAQHQAISRSAARIRETLNFASQDLIQAVRERLTAQELAELRQFHDFAKNGSSFEFIRDRDFGGYWNFEKTLNNNDEVAGTFTRVHVANSDSYIDPSTRLLTFAGAANTPRYPAGKYGHGLLIEGSRENICQESIDFTGAGWSDILMDTTDDTTDLLDPAGGNNAAKMVATDDSAEIKYTTAVAQGGDDGVFSVFVRCVSGTVEGEIQIGSDTPSTDTTVAFTATPEWQRIQAVSENAGGGNWEVRIVIDNDTDVLYGYGAQLEVGADVLFASNFMLTDGATVTRASERLKIAPTNIIGNKKGTIAFWFKPKMQVFDEHAVLFLYEHGDSGGGDVHTKITIDSSGRLECVAVDALGNAKQVLTSLTSAFTAGEWAHIVMTYDSTVSNGVKQYYNGVLLGTSTNDAFGPMANQDFFNIGTNRVGGFHAFGVFDEELYRQDVLPASMIAQIFQQGVGLGEIRNRWAAVALTNPDFLEEQLKGINRYNYQILMEEILS